MGNKTYKSVAGGYSTSEVEAEDDEEEESITLYSSSPLLYLSPEEQTFLLPKSPKSTAATIPKELQSKMFSIWKKLDEAKLLTKIPKHASRAAPHLYSLLAEIDQWWSEVMARSDIDSLNISMLERECKRLQIECLIRLGKTLIELEDNEKAISCYQQILQLSSHSDQQYLCCNNMAVCYMKIGSADQAIFYLQQAYELLEKKKRILTNASPTAASSSVKQKRPSGTSKMLFQLAMDQSGTLFHIGILQFHMKNYKQSQQTLQYALSKLKEMEEKSDILRSRYATLVERRLQVTLHLAKTHDQLGQREKAFEMLNDALIDIEKHQTNNQRLKISILQERSTILGGMSKPREALDGMMECIEASEKLHDPFLQASLLYDTAHYQINDVVNIGPAITSLTRALKIFHSLGKQEEESATLQLLGDTYYRMRAFAVAEKYYLSSVQIRKRWLLSLPLSQIKGSGEDFNSSFIIQQYQLIQRVYYILSQVQVNQLKNYSRALELQEDVRSLLLWYQVLQRNAEYDIFFHENQLLASLLSENGDVTLGAEDIIAIAADRKSTILYYALQQQSNKLMVWVINPQAGGDSENMIQFVEIDFQYQALLSYLQAWFSVLQTQPYVEDILMIPNSKLNKTFEKLTAFLNDRLIRPIEHLLPTSGTHLDIITDSVLSHVPFSGLSITSRSKYMIEEFSISRNLSIKMLIANTVLLGQGRYYRMLVAKMGMNVKHTDVLILKNQHNESHNRSLSPMFSSLTRNEENMDYNIYEAELETLTETLGRIRVQEEEKARTPLITTLTDMGATKKSFLGHCQERPVIIHAICKLNNMGIKTTTGVQEPTVATTPTKAQSNSRSASPTKPKNVTPSSPSLLARSFGSSSYLKSYFSKAMAESEQKKEQPVKQELTITTTFANVSSEDTYEGEVYESSDSLMLYPHMNISKKLQVDDPLVYMKELEQMNLNGTELFFFHALNGLSRSQIMVDGSFSIVHSLTTAGVPSIVLNLWKPIYPDIYHDLLKWFYEFCCLKKHDKAESLRLAFANLFSTNPKARALPVLWSYLELHGSKEIILL